MFALTSFRIWRLPWGSRMRCAPMILSCMFPHGVNTFGKGCSYKFLGHGIKKCLENPNGDHRCKNCGEMGQRPKTCLTKPQNTSFQHNNSENKQGWVRLMHGVTDNFSSDDGFSSSEEKIEPVHVILNEDGAEGEVLVVRRRADGQLMRKGPRADPFDPVTVEKRLFPANKRKEERKGRKHKLTKNRTGRRTPCQVAKQLRLLDSIGKMWRPHPLARNHEQHLTNYGRAGQLLPENSSHAYLANESWKWRWSERKYLRKFRRGKWRKTFGCCPYIS